MRNLKALKGPVSAGQSWNVMEKGRGQYRYSVPGSEALESIFSGPPFWSPQKPRLRRKRRWERESGKHPLPGWTPLVREQAGKRLPQVADGFGLGLVFAWSSTLGSVRCAEAVSQGLGFAETKAREFGGDQA